MPDRSRVRRPIAEIEYFQDTGFARVLETAPATTSGAWLGNMIPPAADADTARRLCQLADDQAVAALAMPVMLVVLGESM